VPGVADVAGVIMGTARILTTLPILWATPCVHCGIVLAATLVVNATSSFGAACLRHTLCLQDPRRRFGGGQLFHMSQVQIVDKDLQRLRLSINSKFQHEAGSSIAMFLHEGSEFEVPIVPLAQRYIFGNITCAPIVLLVETPAVRLSPIHWIVKRNPKR